MLAKGQSSGASIPYYKQFRKQYDICKVEDAQPLIAPIQLLSIYPIGTYQGDKHNSVHYRIAWNRKKKKETIHQLENRCMSCEVFILWKLLYSRKRTYEPIYNSSQLDRTFITLGSLREGRTHTSVLCKAPRWFQCATRTTDSEPCTWWMNTKDVILSKI